MRKNKSCFSSSVGNTRWPKSYAPEIFFRQKYSNEMSIDAVFDGDYKSAILFGKNIYIKNENRKIRVHFTT